MTPSTRRAAGMPEPISACETRSRSVAPTEGPSPVVPKTVAVRQPRSRQSCACRARRSNVDALAGERRHEGRADSEAEGQGRLQNPASTERPDVALTLTCYVVLNPLQARKRAERPVDGQGGLMR